MSTETVNTLPPSPEPAPALLESALRALPGMLNNTPDIRPRPPLRSERRVLYAMLRDSLERIGHARGAAEWAIHWHVEAGRVVAEPIPPPTQFSRNGPGGERQAIAATDREYCVIRATPALWSWSHETERAATGSPLAALRGEQDVLHAFARRRAEDERKRLKEESEREAFRLRWVEAVECAGRIDTDAESNGWDFEQKLAEYIARLLHLGAIIREWDEYHRRWAESRPPLEQYEFRSWGDRLQCASSIADAPIEFRFAAGVTMLAEQGNRAALTEEVRQLVIRRDLKPVSAWFPWLWDVIIPSTNGPERHEGNCSYALPPHGPLEDENRARIALGMRPWIDPSEGFANDGCLAADTRASGELPLSTPDPDPAVPPTGTGQSEGRTTNKADPGKPSQDRQRDILATISAAGTPLTRPELVDAMKLKTEGKLGHQLAWMVSNNILVSILHRGYWPANQPAPE